MAAAKSTFWIFVILVPLIYLFARFSGSDRQVTLSVSVPVIALILALTLIGTALLLHNFFHGPPDSEAKVRARQKFPIAWPFVGVVTACLAGAAYFAIAHEIAKIAVPYTHGSSSIVSATVLRSGDGYQLYGRTQLFDRCAMYVDVNLHNGSSHRLCMRSTIDAYHALADSPPRVGDAIRISTETNRLGTYAVRILTDER